MNRHSSLNDAQAHLDDDGLFRARRLEAAIPGCHNWLDKADFPWGVLQARFYRANDYPEATVTKVPVGVSSTTCRPARVPSPPTNAQAQLHLRRTGAQLRRIW